jgi:hypothetical protein
MKGNHGKISNKPPSISSDWNLNCGFKGKLRIKIRLLPACTKTGLHHGEKAGHPI